MATETREERYARAYEQYAEAFAGHELVHRIESEWMSTFALRRRGTSAYHANVMVSARSITLQGDLDLISFSGGPSNHREKIAWLATSTGSYLVEKAFLGTTCREMIYAYDDDFARQDILTERRLGNITREQAANAMSALRDGNASLATMAVYETGPADDIDLGRCVNQRVFMSHAAVKRLHELLEERSR